MSKITKRLGLIFFLLLFFGMQQANGNGPQKIEWLSFDKAIAKAEKENKHMVIDFYTDWCHWCKVMDEQTYKNGNVVKMAKKSFVFAKINAESNEKLTYRGQQYSYRQFAAALGISGYPATVFFNGKGEFITKVSGFVKPDKFLPILRYFEGEHYTKMSFDDFMKKEQPGSGS